MSTPDVYLNAQDGYDAIAPYYDDWERQKIWPAIEMPHIRTMLKKDREAAHADGTTFRYKLLDLGVGTGRTLKAIHEEFGIGTTSTADGADVSQRMLNIAAAKVTEFDTLTYLDTDELRWHLPFESNSFSHVLMCRVGSHISMISRTLAEAQRIALPGGKIFVSDIHAGHNYTDTHLGIPDKIVHIETHKHSMEEWETAARFLNLKTCFSHVVRGEEIMALPGIAPPKSILSPKQPVSLIMVLEKT